MRRLACPTLVLLAGCAANGSSAPDAAIISQLDAGCCDDAGWPSAACVVTLDGGSLCVEYDSGADFAWTDCEARGGRIQGISCQHTGSSCRLPRAPGVPLQRTIWYGHPATTAETASCQASPGATFVPDPSAPPACDLTGFWSGTRSDTSRTPNLTTPIAFVLSQTGATLNGPMGFSGASHEYVATFSLDRLPAGKIGYDGSLMPACDAMAGTWQIDGAQARGPFALSRSQLEPLSVARSGTGPLAGTVTSSPGGISCGDVDSCTAPFSPGTAVTLTAQPASNAVFVGWQGGGCSGAGNCTVVVNTATTVTAGFDSCNLEAESLPPSPGWSSGFDSQAHSGALLVGTGSFSFTSWASKLVVHYQTGFTSGILSLTIDGGPKFLIDTNITPVNSHDAGLATFDGAVPTVQNTAIVSSSLAAGRHLITVACDTSCAVDYFELCN